MPDRPDKYAALRAAGTNGLNYDLETEDIIARLEMWDTRFGIEIVRAAHDGCTLRFHRLPDDMAAFAEEVDMFCLDAVGQGYGTHEALIETLRESRTLELGWD